MTFMMRMAVLFLLVPTILVGCGTYRWTEEVRLSDGRVVAVERQQKYGGAGGIGNSCWYCRLEKSSLRFVLDGKEYEWHNGTYSFRPMILDVVDGVPVLVTQPRSGNCIRDPNNFDRYYFYIFNVWSGDGWKELTKFDKEIRQTINLVWSRPEDNYVSEEEKNTAVMNGDLKRHMYQITGEYRTYDEAGVKFVPVGCSTWSNPGDFDLKKAQKELLKSRDVRSGGMGNK